jgi:hypothetical protein
MMQAVVRPLVDASDPAQQQEYEFTEEQDKKIVKLAGKMKWVAICLMGIGGVSIFANLVRGSNLMSLLFAVVYALTGYWTFGASKSFRKIVDTRRKDITHLMAAIEKLFNVYNLQFWAIIIAGVVMVLAIGMAIGSMGR